VGDEEISHSTNSYLKEPWTPTLAGKKIGKKKRKKDNCLSFVIGIDPLPF